MILVNTVDEASKSDFIFLIIHAIKPFSGDLGANPRSSHTKDSKNGTWYRLA